MSKLWIDVYDAAGTTKLGDGPITTASDWTNHRLLNAAGDWGFSMPASDPRADLLQEKRQVYAYTIEDGAVRFVGAGIVDQIEAQAGADGEARLQVSGSDLLHELASRTVDDLLVKELQWTYLDGGRGAVRHLKPFEDEDLPEAYDADPATWTDIVTLSDTRWLYIGFDARFDAARITLWVANPHACLLQYQYFARDWGPGVPGWLDLAGLSDGCIVAGVPFAQNGVISWTRPDDWMRVQPTVTAGSWFWVRIRKVAGSGVNPHFRLAEVEVYGDVATTNGIGLIMAYAPAGWALGGYATTLNEAYLEFAGESVLEALVKLGEATGERFRLGTGRDLVWLREDQPISSVRAIRPDGEPLSLEQNVDVCLIERLVETRDAYPLISRIIPHGAGIGDQRSTLEHTTRTPPADFTLDAANNWIRSDVAEAAYGRIEQVYEFDAISDQQLDSWTVCPELASNALYDAAFNYLQEHDEPQRHYLLEVRKVAVAVQPGERMHVVWQQWVDGYRAVDVNTYPSSPLHVVGLSEQVTERGTYLAGLELSTIPRQPESDAGAIVHSMRQVQDVIRRGCRSADAAVEPYEAPWVRGPGLVIAAYDSIDKTHADWVCGGEDDQETINAAIATLGAGGGLVTFLDGHFDITGSINLVTGLQIRGQGVATKLQIPADRTVATTVFAAVGAVADVALSDMWIESLFAARADHGVNAHNTTNLMLERLSFDHFSRAVRGPSIATIANLTVRYCIFTDCSYGVGLWGDTSKVLPADSTIQGVSVYGCSFASCSEAIFVGAGNSLNVAACAFNACGYGIEISNSFNITVTGNRMQDTVSCGMLIMATNDITCRYITISANLIAGTVAAFSTGINVFGDMNHLTAHPWHLNQANDYNAQLSIVGNEIRSFEVGIEVVELSNFSIASNVICTVDHGVRVANVWDGSITSNQISDCDVSAINLGYEVDSVTVSGNTISDSGRYGIILSGASHCSVTSNTISEVSQDANDTYPYILLTASGPNGSDNNIVSGNACQPGYAANQGNYGVQVGAGCSDNAVVENDLRNSGVSGDFDDGGTDTIYSGVGDYIAHDSLWDAAGDLAVATAPDEATRLPVGLDGQVLTADSLQPEGVAWADPTGDVATDAIWDAKADLAVGIGPDAAARLPGGLAGQHLTPDVGEATGLKWVDPDGAPAVALHVDGVLAIDTDLRAFVCPGAGVIRYVYIRCKTPGNANSTIVDVHLNAVTIFTAQANRPELAWNDPDGVAKSGIPDVTVLAENDVLTVDVDAIGTLAADLVVVIAVEWDAPAAGAPTNADYWVETANAGLSAEIVVGTTGIASGAYAALPAAAKAGRLYFPSDSFYVVRDDGAVQRHWGPLFYLTPPPALGTWAWVNQGGATASETNGGIYLSVAAEGGPNCHILMKAAPAPPYTIEAAILPNLYPADSVGCGVGWRQSSDGKLAYARIRYGVGVGDLSLRVDKWTNPTTWLATYITLGMTSAWSHLCWLRIEDDGVNRKTHISWDGIHWWQVHSVARADFLTADQVVFLVTAMATGGAGANLFHWRQV